MTFTIDVWKHLHRYTKTGVKHVKNLSVLRVEKLMSPTKNSSLWLYAPKSKTQNRCQRTKSVNEF